MKRRTWYKLHKWVAVGSGAALLVWCVSGLALVLPTILPSMNVIGGPTAVGPDPDFSTVTVSPAEAVAGAAATGANTRARSIELRKVGERMAYDVQFQNGSQALVDAHSGEPFTVDSALAVSLARMRANSEAEVTSFETLTHRTGRYPFGRLPAYMMEFGDAPGVTFTTEIATGAVVRLGASGRIRNFVERTHTFSPVNAFLPNVGRGWVMILFTVATGLAAAMGFWIALPKTWIPVWLGGVSKSRTAPRDEEVSDPAA